MYEFIFTREQQMDNHLQNHYFEIFGNRIHKRRSVPLIIAFILISMYLLAFICFGYTGDKESIKNMIIGIIDLLALLIGIVIFVVKGKSYYFWLEGKQTHNIFEKGSVVITVYDDKLLLQESNKSYILTSFKKRKVAENSAIIRLKAFEDDEYIYLTRSGMFYFIYFKKNELSEEELRFIKSSLEKNLGKMMKRI